MVEASLAHGVDPNHAMEVCPAESMCGQTALIKAVRYGHAGIARCGAFWVGGASQLAHSGHGIMLTTSENPDTCRLLLDAGANAAVGDYKARTVWYYVCYSITIPDHAIRHRLCTLLLEHPQAGPLTSAHVHMAAHAPQDNGVLAAVLDFLGHTCMCVCVRARPRSAALLTPQLHSNHSDIKGLAEQLQDHVSQSAPH